MLKTPKTKFYCEYVMKSMCKLTTKVIETFKKMNMLWDIFLVLNISILKLPVGIPVQKKGLMLLLLVCSSPE